MGRATRDGRRALAATNDRISASGRVFSTCCGPDPAASRRPHAEGHLRAQRLHAMAVAVDRERDAGLRRRSRPFAVEVHVAWRAVDLEGRSGRGSGGVERVEVEIVACESAHELVCGMAEDVHERVPECREAALGELRRRHGARDRGATPARCRTARGSRLRNRGGRPGGCRPRCRAGSSCPGKRSRCTSISSR